MYVDTVRDKLCLPIINNEVLLTHKNGHMCLEWPKQSVVLITKQELVKKHQGFSRPSNNKYLRVDSKTNLIPEDFVKHGRNYQRYSPSPLRLKAAIPTEKNLDFSDEVSVELIF